MTEKQHMVLIWLESMGCGDSVDYYRNKIIKENTAIGGLAEPEVTK